MGHMRHHAIVVTGSGQNVVEARIAAQAIFSLHDSDAPITTMTHEVVNGYQSFAVLPDGSKEGWNPSDRGDAARAAFVKWLRDHNSYCDWAEVQYGDDEHETKIVTHSDEGRNEDGEYE